MWRRLSILGAVTALALPVATTGAYSLESRQAGKLHPAQVSVTGYGWRLTMHVPQRSYPANALAAVRVTLRNVSSRPASFEPQVVGFCIHAPFLLNVLDAAGSPLSPLPPDPSPLPPCAAPIPRMVHPGKAVAETVLVVLLSGRLQATANVDTRPHRAQGYYGGVLTTPIVTVAFHAAQSPPVTVQDGNVATVARPAHATGPLRYEQWVQCGTSVTHSHAPYWGTSPNDSLSAGCAAPTAWHLVAGWPGYPVAHVDVPANTVAIKPPFSPTPYTARVGDAIVVSYLLFGPGVATATSDSSSLQMISSVSKSAEPVYYTWTWRAVSAGDARIIISRQGPALPPMLIRVHIVP